MVLKYKINYDFNMHFFSISIFYQHDFCGKMKTIPFTLLTLLCTTTFSKITILYSIIWCLKDKFEISNNVRSISLTLCICWCEIFNSFCLVYWQLFRKVMIRAWHIVQILAYCRRKFVTLYISVDDLCHTWYTTSSISIQTLCINLLKNSSHKTDNSYFLQ